MFFLSVRCFFVWFCGFVSLYFVHHSFSLILFVRSFVHFHCLNSPRSLYMLYEVQRKNSVKMLNGEPITTFYWMILCTRYVLRLIHAHLFILFLVNVFFLISLSSFHTRWLFAQLLLLLREHFLFAPPTTILYSYDILILTLFNATCTRRSLLMVSKFSVVFSFLSLFFFSFLCLFLELWRSRQNP